MGVVRTISTPKKYAIFQPLMQFVLVNAILHFSDIPATTFKKSRSQLRERKKSDFRRAEILTEFDEQQHLNSVISGEDFRLADMCDSQELSSTVQSFHFYLFFSVKYIKNSYFLFISRTIYNWKFSGILKMIEKNTK